MSEPPYPKPDDHLPPRPPWNSGPLGIVLGLVYLAVFVALNIFLPAQRTPGPFCSVWVPLLGFLVGAIVLAKIPRTSNLGAGLLISLGFSLLVGAGLCIALLPGTGPA